jgi:hypothetical protein
MMIMKTSVCYLLVSCLAYSSTLKTEATCSSEMSVDFQQVTPHYIPRLQNANLIDLIRNNYHARIS